LRQNIATLLAGAPAFRVLASTMNASERSAAMMRIDNGDDGNLDVDCQFKQTTDDG